LVKLVHLVTADILATAVCLATAAQQVLLDTLEQAATAVEAAFQALVATLASVHQDILVFQVTAALADIQAEVGIVVEAGILVQAYLDIQDLVLAAIQVQAAFQGFLESLVILEFQVTLEHRAIQAHLDIRASADTQVHQVIPVSADTQVRLAFLAILEQADILEPVVTVAYLGIRAYLVSADILALWALAVHKVTGDLFGTQQLKQRL
jgi:hypothetical protein